MPGRDAMAWATAEARRDPQLADPELAALRLLQAAYIRLAAHGERLPAMEQAVRLAGTAAIAARQHADECLQSMVEDAEEVADLLQAAHVYVLRYPDPRVCPLCESADAAWGLSERITQRLRVFSTLQHAQAEKKTADERLHEVEQEQKLLRGQAEKDAIAFESARAQFAWSTDIPMPATSAPKELGTLTDWLRATAALPAQWQQAEAARLEQRPFLATLKSALHTYTENMQGQEDLDILLPNLQRALEIVAEERKNFTDTILSRIADEVGRMYEAVHPGEGLNKISLELDAKKRASLEIGSSFGGRAGTPPQAYFSESHLDTLGLCVFLALATLDDPTNTILVLDDVLASVDEPHIDRLINMLYAEAARFRHCVITTHYGPWKHKYRWGWLKNGQCQFIELSKWTNVTGMTLTGSVPEVQRLKALLADDYPDPQLVCAKAGVILEASLDFLTRLYQCKVARKREYALGDLLSAIDKKLRRELRVDVLIDTDPAGAQRYQTIELAPILDELQRIFQVRNVIGCHFNAIAHDLLDTDAVRFGEQVLVLIEALSDADAGWPIKSKSGSYWATGDETRRLHPLRQPE